MFTNDSPLYLDNSWIRVQTFQWLSDKSELLSIKLNMQIVSKLDDNFNYTCYS